MMTKLENDVLGKLSAQENNAGSQMPMKLTLNVLSINIGYAICTENGMVGKKKTRAERFKICLAMLLHKQVKDTHWVHLHRNSAISY